MSSVRAAALDARRRLLALDEATLWKVRGFETPLTTRWMRTITHLGDAPVWCAIALVLWSAGGASADVGSLVASSAGLATAVSQAAKRSWRRRRPNKGIQGFVALVENPDSFSFPSGHTAAAFAVAVAVTGQSSSLVGLAWGFASAVAISRVYLGAHYPLDVAVGALLGCLAGLACHLI